MVAALHHQVVDDLMRVDSIQMIPLPDADIEACGVQVADSHHRRVWVVEAQRLSHNYPVGEAG